MKHTSDGSTADYYELPKGAEELQHLISYRDMNGQMAEIFRACYRYGIVSHSPKLRDAKKIKFYIEAEIARLEKYDSHDRNAPFPDTHLDFDEARADAIGQNGNDGEHYAEDMTNPANWRTGDLVVCTDDHNPARFIKNHAYRVTAINESSACEIELAESEVPGLKISYSRSVVLEHFRFHSRPSADGWIDWPGGECPCDGVSMVEVETRSVGKGSATANTFGWSHGGSPSDIIRYRML